MPIAALGAPPSPASLSGRLPCILQDPAWEDSSLRLGLKALPPPATVPLLLPMGSNKERTQALQSDLSAVRSQSLHSAVGVSEMYFTSLSYSFIIALAHLYFSRLIPCHWRCSPQVSSTCSSWGLLEMQNLRVSRPFLHLQDFQVTCLHIKVGESSGLIMSH